MHTELSGRDNKCLATVSSKECYKKGEKQRNGVVGGWQMVSKVCYNERNNCIFVYADKNTPVEKKN